MKKPGKLVMLVHNPTAGDGAHSKQEIISLIASQGYKCIYSSSKKKILKTIDPETEFIAIAGGDGTIRKAIMKLLGKKLKDKRPIALLPFGTANNIATSLKIPENHAKNIACWSAYNLKKFDVGQVIGLEKTSYFIESFGFGLFARLMKVLDNMDTRHIQTSEDEFKMALEELLKITKKYEASAFRIEIGEQVIEEDCIMVEVMNISSLGPQLKLSKDADPGDGYFDVVIVTGKQRKLMEDYIIKKHNFEEPVFPVKPIRTKNLKITWNGKDSHADDEIIKDYGPITLKVSLLDSLIEIVTHTKPI